jgi:hypothetical protein
MRPISARRLLEVPAGRLANVATSSRSTAAGSPSADGRPATRGVVTLRRALRRRSPANAGVIQRSEGAAPSPAAAPASTTAASMT